MKVVCIDNKLKLSGYRKDGYKDDYKVCKHLTLGKVYVVTESKTRVIDPKKLDPHVIFIIDDSKRVNQSYLKERFKDISDIREEKLNELGI